MSTSADRSPGNTTGEIFLDSEALRHLKSSSNIAQSCSAWLATLGRINPAVQQGVVVLSGAGRTRMEPMAVWPGGASPVKGMMSAVNNAAKAERLIIETISDGGVAIGMPVTMDNRLRGMIGLLVGPADEEALRLLIDQMNWASGWIEAMIRRRRSGDRDSLATVIEVMATSLHHARFQESATAVATELAGALNCEMAAIGLMRGRHCRVRALSNSASFGKRANLVRGIEAAMDEAADQQSVIVFPVTNDAPDRVIRAHKSLAETEGMHSLCTVPLVEGSKVIGALFLERVEGEHFDTDAVQLAEHAAILLGPVLDVKRREDRWLPAKAFDAGANFFKALFGPRHAGLKLAVILTAAAVTFAWYAQGTYRVTSDTVLEGSVQRAVTAPMPGFLVEANKRAGDIVKENEVIARLDQRDLRLERMRWASEIAKQEREYSQAVAQRERTEARVLQSQLDQGQAQIRLLDSQIERMVLRAPFAGVVVAGDLTQALGAPVERGDVLFEIAPLDDYRVMMQVDERDIGDVVPGQEGSLILAALPDTPLRIEVERLTPISTPVEGANVFSVQSRLIEPPLEVLRPGMEGVSKIEIDERRLVWIWTRRLVLWARMTAWSWWP